MKNDRIQDLLNGVEPDLIAEAAPKSVREAPQASAPMLRRHRAHRWIPALAALLTVMILLGALFGGGLMGIDPSVSDTTSGTWETEDQPSLGLPARHLLQAPTYPLVAPYPGNNATREQFLAWVNWYRERTVYYGAGDNLDAFFQKTVAQFLSDAGDENLVYSPLSVYFGLAMLAEVTASESRQQILDLLNCDSIEDLRIQAHAIWNANYVDDGRSTNILASSLWLNQNLPYEQEALVNLAQYYYAASFLGEMGSDTYDQALRDWMNEQTDGLLKGQIDGIEMSPQTVISLVSTVCFSGQWDTPFRADHITREPFYGTAGESACEMMHRTLDEALYRWGDHFTAAGLSMAEGRIDFLLPDEGVSVSQLLTDEQALSYILNGDTGKNQREMVIHVSVPKFDAESQMDLAEDLKALGVTDCFDEDRADFSALTPLREPVYVSKALHGSRVIVNEQGAKAVSYFYMDEVVTSPPPKELQEINFTVDRPFIFIIRNAEGLPLFVGVINQVG